LNIIHRFSFKIDLQETINKIKKKKTSTMKIIVIKASRSKEITFQNKKLQNLLLIFTTKSLLILNFQKKERKKERMKIPL